MYRLQVVLLVWAIGSAVVPASGSTLVRLNCETVHQVCYLKNVYATNEDRYKDINIGDQFSHVIEFFDSHMYTLPRIPYIGSVIAKASNLVQIKPNTFTTVNKVDLTSNNLQEFSSKAFEWPKEVQVLRISGNPLLKDLGFLTPLTHLTELYLAHMRLDLDFVQLSTFHEMKLLHTLDMSHNRIISIPVGMFNKLESLKELDLSNNFIAKVHTGALVIHFRPPNIFDESEQHRLNVNLCNNSITIIENYAFASIDYLDLSNNKLVGVGQFAFHNRSTLQTLSLSSNYELKNFDFLHNLPALHTIVMSNMNFSFRTAPKDIFDDLVSLTSLDLSNNHIKDIPIGIFAELQSLNYISLRHNRISHIEFGTFSIRKYDLIDEIDLSYNDIKQLNYLVFVPLKYLKTLLLHSNKISYVNAKDLVRNKSLLNFGIQNNVVRCDDLVDLLGHIKLVLDRDEFIANMPNVNGIRCLPT